MNGIKVVKVRFTGSNTHYSFRCSRDIFLDVGDLVVVNCATGFQVAEVIAIIDIPRATDLTKATAWVVQRVELEAHKMMLEREEELRRMKAKIDKRRKELEAEVVYEAIAAKDPAFASLLASYKEAGGSLGE